MGFFSGARKVVKPLVDVPRWMHSKRLVQTSGHIVDIAKTLFIPRKAKRLESFNDALDRLKLTETDLKQRIKEFTRLFFIFLAISMLVFVYTIYLFISGHFSAALLSTVVTGIGLSQAFRYHFWLLQIKERKLGLSARDWFKVGLLGKNK